MKYKLLKLLELLKFVISFNTCRLARTKGYMDRIIKEAIEIKLHPDNINRDGGFILSRAWQPAIHQIRTSQRGVGAQQLTACPPT
jgi:hypothetical protein